MNFEKEMSFLRRTFAKCRIKTIIISQSEALLASIDETFEALFKNDPDKHLPIKSLHESLEKETVYKFTDRSLLNYIYFSLSDNECESDRVFLAGPYLSTALSPEQMLEIGELLGILPKDQKTVDKYYSNLPVISEKSRIFMMIDSFCEIFWKNPLYKVVDVVREQGSPSFSISRGKENVDIDEAITNMKIMEERYSWENDLMRAVSLGQSNKLEQLIAAFSEISFEKRATDQLRNMKNYLVIMNTLLRKAAEQGGVHPIYLDSVSASFAIRIEQGDSVAKLNDVVIDMLRSYFRLVRKHSVSGHSPIVKNVIIIIDSDLSADLSLSTIAKAQNVSEGYLSSLFKKEMGKTITEYIRERRIDHAKHLLKTTQLQIQTVALHCGIVDVQYFSKLFKKETGKSPKEYRESKNNHLKAKTPS